MATIETFTLSSDDTATMLRAKLGPLRAWRDFLTDCIRGTTTIAGHALPPCGKRHDGRSLRPIYALPQIEDFVEKVLAAVPGAGKIPLVRMPLAIDPSRAWQLNRFDRHGVPMPM